DGIRDFHVTGVQTCALPIYGIWPACPSFSLSRTKKRLWPAGTLGSLVGPCCAYLIGNRVPSWTSLTPRGPFAPVGFTIRFRKSRSEERRVGKEQRVRSAANA